MFLFITVSEIISQYGTEKIFLFELQIFQMKNIMLKKVTLTLLLALVTIANIFAQKKSPLDAESTSDFPVDSAVTLLLNELNRVRTENGLDSLAFNDMLQKASELQSENMADKGKADLENTKGKYKTTAKRVISVGGTRNADEIVINMPIAKDKKNMSTKEFANAVIAKWMTGKKEPTVIKNGNYVYASPSIKLDASGKKAFVSVVFGSFNTFNKGAKKRKELPVRFTKKNKKIKAPDDKACKNCDKFRDYEGLIEGLYVESGKIFLKYDNLKALLSVIAKPEDGLAVDVIQRAQYEKPDYNIMNNNLLSKGVLSKTVKKEKLLKLNREKADKKGKAAKLDVQLGVLPKKLPGDSQYEINLLIIQNGKLCKTVVKSYVEQGDQNSTTALKMLLMPDSAAYFKPPFSPKADDALLKFTVPFEKNKYDYKESDIVPFLNAMQEPDFIINSIYITAYSSIEGDAVSNAKLQNKRSESIINALGSYQKKGVTTKIKTSDSWDLFQMSMEGTPYDSLGKLPKEQAIHEINTRKGLSEELEPYLSKQRFGEIVMDVTYDISGAKEEKFSISKFNQAIKKKDVPLALKIQYYVGKQIREKKYSPEVLNKLEIPKEAKFSGLLNNKIVLKSMANNNAVDEDDYMQMKKVSEMDPDNSTASFNTLYCAVKMDSTVGDQKDITAMQTRISALYKSNVPKKYVDALNIEWQFKIIDEKNSEEGAEPIIQACTDKVKSFYNLKEGGWQNNLKLAYIFARFKDYKYASSLLSDFIKKNDVNEQVLFAYISFCAKVPELFKTRLFVLALQKAEHANHDRYCKLFGSPFLTFQVFDNPFVKEDYAKFNCN